MRTVSTFLRAPGETDRFLLSGFQVIPAESLLLPLLLLIELLRRLLPQLEGVRLHLLQALPRLLHAIAGRDHLVQLRPRRRLQLRLEERREASS